MISFLASQNSSRIKLCTVIIKYNWICRQHWLSLFPPLFLIQLALDLFVWSASICYLWISRPCIHHFITRTTLYIDGYGCVWFLYLVPFPWLVCGTHLVWGGPYTSKCVTVHWLGIFVLLCFVILLWLHSCRFIDILQGFYIGTWYHTNAPIQEKQSWRLWVNQ